MAASMCKDSVLARLLITALNIIIKFLIIAISLLAHLSLHAVDRPNIVLTFLDDAGYSDFHPIGNPPYPTPNVKKLASEGVSYTRFHVPQAVCSTSRTSLLTGCYPHHTRITGAIGPGNPGLDPHFPIMSETLKEQGYATAHFGKWHIGDVPETRPTARGFDEHAGLLISNDMWPHNHWWRKRVGDAPLPYWENGGIKIPEVSPGNDGERGETKTSPIDESLFNLIKDPLEQKNIIAEHPEMAEQLKQAARAHLKKYPLQAK